MTPILCGISVMDVTPSLRTGIGFASATKLPVMLGVVARDGILIEPWFGPNVMLVPSAESRENTGDGVRLASHSALPCCTRSPAHAGTLVSAPDTAACVTHLVASESL